MYQHSLNRLKVMTRGVIVGLINYKSLSQQSGSYDNGRAVTLMSTDAESVGNSTQMFHETWAQIIEVVLGTLMLAKEVGWICPVPLVIIFCELSSTSRFVEQISDYKVCSRVSQYLARNLQGKQRDWNVATQERLAVTTSMLTSIKSIKMLGVTPYTESLINSLRLQELRMAKKVRWMMVAYNASGASFVRSSRVS